MYFLIKKFLRGCLRLIYRVEIHGLDHYHQAGNRVLIVANHSSYLDPLLLGVFLPDRITFAINTHISQRWWLKPFLGLSNVFPMDPTHPISLRNLIYHLKSATKTVIFPEGRITVTGSMMKIYDGTGMVADKSGATILPIKISGGEYTPFSKLKKIVRLRWFPKITLTILPATVICGDQHLRGKLRRQSCGRALADLMNDMVFKTSAYQQTLFSSLLAARKVHGHSHKIVEDLARTPLSYNALITAVMAMANALAPQTKKEEPIGVFLPNASNTLVVILALQVNDRIPAMLNYTMGAVGMLSACHTAEINTVLTSRQFIERGKLATEAQALSQQLTLIYLEDLAEKITAVDKLKALFQCWTADYWYPKPLHNANNAAIILFTSGSEGTPKGVVLSHRNILANINQIKARIGFNPQDTVLNFLPLFHSFGFTAGTILPLMNGIKIFFYPTPLHYSIVPEMAYELDASIMFGTNTFLAAYAKKAHVYDFYNMRYVIAGAEKLQPSTRDLWMEKFGIRLLEGYGATETAPVISVNTFMDFKAGTVGRFMPGMRYQLEKIPGIEVGGKLHVTGDNVMKGYLLADHPGKLVPPCSHYGQGWYDTGDIVEVDEDGFILIKGRSKRFAKIGGEMVSLTVVEALVNKTWPTGQHVVVNVPDSRKGEQIILLTTETAANLAELKRNAPGFSAIHFPRKIFVLATLPLLATGKMDYPQATKIALKKLAPK
jgi:acyl-[acyl-carrier-protein]-phospholipid O-acyltransferase/long-chain-fatty-acid--[acyl-carrier-protein] ligase